MEFGCGVSIYPEKKLLTNPSGPLDEDEDLSNTNTNNDNVEDQIVVPFNEVEGRICRNNKVNIDINAMPEDEEKETDDEEEVCRICQDEDPVWDLEIPCGCMGSLMYAHRSCIQRWCDTSRSIKCEICKKDYSPGYIVKNPFKAHETPQIISEAGYMIPWINIRIYSPLELFHMAIHRISISMNQDFNLRNLTAGALLRFALLIFIAVVVITDAYNNAPPREHKFNHTLYCIITIIVVPVYILHWIFLLRVFKDYYRNISLNRVR